MAEVARVSTDTNDEKHLDYQDQVDFVNGDTLDYSGLEKPWYKYPYLIKLIGCILVLTLNSTNNGYDGSMLNGLQVLTIWAAKMGNPEGARLGVLNNGAVFGGILSFPFVSWMADKFGRKKSILIGAFINFVGAMLQGASTDFGFFLASRIILGFGAGIAAVSGPALISEIAYAPHRNICTSMYNVSWYIGAIIAAWVTFGTRNMTSEYSWKIPSYIQGVLPLCAFVLTFFIPESPRYLIAKGKVDKARAILSKYHFGDGQDERSLRLLNGELKEIEVALEMEKVASRSSYSDFIRIPSFRKRLFLTVFTAVMLQLSGNGLVSYYLNKVLDSIGITDETKKLEINGCLMIYNFVISCFAAYATRLFKRRTLFITAVALMLVTFVIWTILSAINQERNFSQKSLANGVLAMIFLFNLSYNIGLNGLPFLYITEILPYTHRSKGLNIFQVVTQLSLCYNGFVNPIAMDAIEWKYYIVYCCILVVELLVVIFTFVETSGYTLEEVARVFGDDPSAVLPNLAYDGKDITVEHREKV